ncbi:hypothetical protein HDU67_008706 [Dinochytrium kinnereticum]|nr:hypothetical protein HDU67_008706 [Dinochytrium kinnereticum]
MSTSADQSLSLSMHQIDPEPTPLFSSHASPSDILSDPLFADLLAGLNLSMSQPLNTIEVGEEKKHIMTLSGTRIEDAGGRIEEVVEMVIEKEVEYSDDFVDEDCPLSLDDLSRERVPTIVVQPPPPSNPSASLPKLELDKEEKMAPMAEPPLLMNSTSITSPSNSSRQIRGSISEDGESSIKQVISRLAQQDLKTDEEAFREWLQRKKKRALKPHHTSSSSPILSQTPQAQSMPKSAPPQSTSNASMTSQNAGLEAVEMTEEKKLEKQKRKQEANEKAFRAWLSKKQSKALEDEIKQRAEVERQKKVEEEKRSREIEKMKRAKEAVAKWKELKEKADKAREEAEQQKLQHLADSMAQKKKRGEQAFQTWQHRIKSQTPTPSSTSTPFYPHPSPWKNIGDVPQISRTLPRAQSAQEYLSPPLLYREHAFYEKAAPDFLRKYRIWVASGGRGLEIGGNGLAVSPGGHKRRRIVEGSGGRMKSAKGKVGGKEVAKAF